MGWENQSCSGQSETHFSEEFWKSEKMLKIGFFLEPSMDNQMDGYHSDQLSGSTLETAHLKPYKV